MVPVWQAMMLSRIVLKTLELDCDTSSLNKKIMALRVVWRAAGPLTESCGNGRLVRAVSCLSLWLIIEGFVDTDRPG